MHVSKKEFQFSIDNKNRSMVDKKKKKKNRSTPL